MDIDRINGMEVNEEEVEMSFDFSQNVYLKHLQRY